MLRSTDASHVRGYGRTTAGLYHCKNIIPRLGFSISRQVLHFCMCNFVFVDKADWSLSVETKLHIQKYDGLENIHVEIRSRALEVDLASVIWGV